MNPSNAVAAASHPDPYPYYRQLLAGPELVFDPALGCWIASRAAVIEEAMANHACRVRPAGELVPSAIAGSSAGTLFGRLLRMNDGALHAQAKRAIGQALASIDMAAAQRRSTQLAAALARQHGVPDGAALTRWLFELPTHVMADMLGFGQADLPKVAQCTAGFVRCLSPLSTPGQLAGASTAAQALEAAIARLLQDGQAEGLAHRAAQHGWPDQDALIANLVGLLSQTHEATAGLIGNCIVALLQQDGMQARLRDAPQLAGAFVREVARYDPAVQNTRRFVAHATSVAGMALQAGDTILLLLAAAGRDKQANPDADDFLLERAGSRLAGFGHARHACPGRDLAFTIAASAMQHLLALAHPLTAQTLAWRYAPSANARLPLFSTPLKGQP